MNARHRPRAVAVAVPLERPSGLGAALAALVAAIAFALASVTLR